MSSDLAAAANDASKHIFPFFELPKELRDMVYENNLKNRIQMLKVDVHLSATNVTSTNLLLVSKQFKTELEERSQKHSHLTIRDAWGPVPPECHNARYHKAVLPPAAIKIPHVTISPAVNMRDNIHPTPEWTARLLAQMDCVKSLDIKLLVDAEYKPERSRAFAKWASELHDEKWQKLEPIRSLQLLFCGCGGYYQNQGAQAVFKGKHGPPELVVEWKTVEEGTGQERRVEWVKGADDAKNITQVDEEDADSDSDSSDSDEDEAGE